MRTLLCALFASCFLPVLAVESAPPAPTSLVMIACRVDDLTGLPGRTGNGVRDWRDLEWHLSKGLELECKRIVLELQDAVQFSPKATNNLIPLEPDFSDFGQCSARAMAIAPMWAANNSGWYPLKIGCPVAIKQDLTGDGPSVDDPIIGWHMPECPNGIRCVYDESHI